MTRRVVMAATRRRRSRTVPLICSALLAIAAGHAAAQEPPGSTLTVRVRQADGVAIAGARVTVDELPAQAALHGDGSYVFTGLSPGRYTLRVVRLGFAPFVEQGLAIDGDVTRDVVLEARAVPLSQVVIAPGVYGGLDTQSPSLQVVSREDLLTRPQLAEDLFRSLNRLPGFAGSDFSAKLRVRNSTPDEVLYTLDGMELVEPYHMKDFDGALTIVDQDAIGRIELSAGGFGAQFGTRAAGVIQMHSATPEPGRARTALGLSLSNVRARSEGSFHQSKGAWLVSARRGYLDIVFKLIGEEEAPNPTYYDVLAKVQRTLGTRHVVSLNTLIANDALTFAVDRGFTTARGSYGNAYGWGTLRSQWREGLQSTTLASVAALSWDRNGQEAEFFGSSATVRAGFDDRRTLVLAGLKQDWSWDVSSKVSALFGGEVRQEDADYDYRQFAVRRARLGSSTVVLDSADWRLARAAGGSRQSAYAAIRLRPTSAFTSELGLRSDRHSWTGQRTLTPRMNVRWDALRSTSLRLAWGTYTQAQGLQDLSVVDGDSVFARAEESVQRVVGVEHRTSVGWTGRLEVFERRIQNPRPRWYSADGELDPFPEGQLDRVQLAPDSSLVRGAEVVATYDRGGRVKVSAWYSRMQGRMFVGERTTARPNEEPHAGAIDLVLRTGAGWSWGLAWTGHSGWPNIPAQFALDTLAPGQVAIRRVAPEAQFTGRLSGYQRLDVRVSKRFVAGRGAVEAFVEVFNLFDRANQRGWSYDVFARNGRLDVRPVSQSFVGRLPTVGVRWVF